MDNELRIVQGNTFATAIEIHAVDATGQPIVDWSLQDSTDIRVWYVFAGREQEIATWQIDDGKLVILWLANMQRVGTYDIFCAGKYNGADWRNAMQYQFRIVRFNHEANIPANVVILDGIYQLSAELQIITQFQGGGGGGTPSQTLPLMDGVAQVGTENAYARGDHRHPSDTSKQDVIADLDAIRSGAAAGATAVQPAALSGYQPLIDNANKLDYSLLDNTPTIPAAQVNSDWNANSGVAQILNKPAIPAAQVQSDWNEADNTKADYIKNKPAIPSISGLESTSNKVTSLSAASTDTQYPSAKCVYDGLGGKQDTIDSAHKLDYSLLDNTPTIPAAQVNSDWNANSGVAQILNKPTIPAAQVQANWNESDTDSKAYIQNKPTIPAAQVQSNWNESDTNSKAYIQNKPTIPAAGIPSGGNAGQVLTKTDGSTDYAVAWRDTNNIFPSAYCTTAAATAAKGASCTFWTATANSYLHILLKNANTNQGALSLNVNSTGAKPIYINGTVSSSTNYTLPAGSYIVFYDGTNYYFRTDGKLTASITGAADGVNLGSLTDVSTTGATNGQVLGYNGSSWEPTNAGGGGDTPIVNHGTSDTTYTLPPNELHIWGTVPSLAITLGTPTDATIENEYKIQFTSGATATQFSLPQGVEWGTQDPEQPNPLVVKANAIYQISIINNIGLWTAISNS